MNAAELRALRRAIALLRLDRGRFVWSVVAGALALGSGVGLAACSAWLIARASQMPSVLDLTVAAVAVRTFGVSRAVMRYVERLASHEVALRGVGALQHGVYESLAAGHPAAVTGLRRGDLLARTGRDVEEVGDVVVRAVLPMAVTAVVGVGTVALVSWLHPGIGLVLAACLLLAGVLGPWLAVRGARLDERAVLEGRTRVSEVAVRMVDHGPELTVGGLLPSARTELTGIEQRLARSRDRAARPAALAVAIDNLALGLALLGALVIGIPAVAAGTLNPVELAVVVLTPLAAFEGTAGLGTAAVQLVRSAGAAERIMALLDDAAAEGTTDVAAEEVADGGEHHHGGLPGATTAASTSATDGAGSRLQARGLEAGWPGHAVVLGGVDLALVPGRSLAVVGPSGIGKTTLLFTLAGLLPARGGRLELAGAEMAELDRAAVSSRLVLTAEDAHVFATTVLENIRVARGDVSPAEAETLLARAGLGDWLAGLPDGLHTELGAGGATISGGQRRRLLLARALASRAELLLLDEPGEHLDPAAADALITDLLTVARDEGRGVLLVTHRLSPLAAADEVVVLGTVDGRAATVQARGTHAELVNRDADYRWAVAQEAVPTPPEEDDHGHAPVPHPAQA